MAKTSTVSIITNCTQRKAGRNRVAVAQLPEATSLLQLVETWRQAVDNADADTPVQSLYRGRTILDTASVAMLLDAPWYVVSAGLGLVEASQSVPAYECTVATGSDLHRRLRTLDCSTAQWWTVLTSAQPAPLSRVITETQTLLALPSSYLRMVKDDLAQVSPARIPCLRIFTSATGADYVPDHLKVCVMPYDERLESVRGRAGTRSDFAQRALRHFVEQLQATSMPLDEARDAVLTSLANLPRRPRSVGQRMTDEEIQQVLTSQWARHSGSSTKLLRFLRDEARISCEQKRFSRLWQKLCAQLRG